MTLLNSTLQEFSARLTILLVPLMLMMSPHAHGTNHSAGTTTNEYRYEVIQQHVQRQLHDTFVAAAFSGGGMRAASLAYGALTALRDTPINKQAGNFTQSTRKNVLLSEVDFVSSVSGGSVTAAYWALHGTTEKFNEFEKKFLKRKVQDDLITRILDPVSLLKFLGTKYSRSDALSDYYKEELFGEVTYRDLLDRTLRNQDRPYLIVNATDMDTRSLFPFVQLQLDLICEDLTKMPIAKAVAASTAYPLAFPAVVLENKSHLLDACPKFLAKSKVDVGVKKNADLVGQVEKSWHNFQTDLNQQETRVKKRQERLDRQTETLEASIVEVKEKREAFVGVDQEFQVVSRNLNQAKIRHSELDRNYSSAKSAENLIYQQIQTLNGRKSRRNCSPDLGNRIKDSSIASRSARTRKAPNGGVSAALTS